MGWFSRTSETCSLTKDKGNSLKDYEQQNSLIPPSDLPKWVEITGYKAVDADMRSFYGDFQFKLGERYTAEGEIIPCQNGFHFCLGLNSVMKLFPPQFGRRYFKVKALTKMNYYTDDNEKTWKSYPASCLASTPNYIGTNQAMVLNMKYVAKEIILIEEIPFNEISPYIHSSFLKNEENYRNIKDKKDLEIFAAKEWNKVTQEIFSNAFSQYFFNEYILKAKRSTTKDISLAIRLDDAIKIVDAIKDENISQMFEYYLYSKRLLISKPIGDQKTLFDFL